jgi:uncharacterized protein
MKGDYIDNYLKVREKIDANCSQLWKLHKNNMVCSVGCSSCCQAFKILPVEFFAIEELLKNESVKINRNYKADECKFLIDNCCSIYQHRPIICRTHGFPLVRVNDMDDTFEISFCHLNFKSVKLDAFKKTNVFYEEKYNIKLFKLNQKFLSKWPSKENLNLSLIDLNKLKINNH